MAASLGFLQAFCKQEPLDAAVPNSPGCRCPLPMATNSHPLCRAACVLSLCSYQTLLLVFPRLPAHPRNCFSLSCGCTDLCGPCTRCSLPISTFSSGCVPAGAGPQRLGTPALTAAMLPVCGADREPPWRRRALQKPNFSDQNKLLDFAHLVEITEIKKLLLRMTDDGPNDQTA